FLCHRFISGPEGGTPATGRAWAVPKPCSTHAPNILCVDDRNCLIPPLWAIARVANLCPVTDTARSGARGLNFPTNIENRTFLDNGSLFFGNRSGSTRKALNFQSRDALVHPPRCTIVPDEAV